MSKLDDIANARITGMVYATKQIESVGLDEWKKELQLRNRNGISVPAPAKEVIRNADSIQTVFLQCCLLGSLAVLMDEFDFNSESMARFRDRFNEKLDNIGSSYASWQDYIDVMKEEYDLEVGFVIEK